MIKLFKRFISCDEGPTTVEYAVLLALIITMCISAITLVGGQTGGYWGNNRDQLGTALDK